MLLSIVTTEVLICIKFGWDTITKPLPYFVKWWWLAFGFGLLAYTFVKFVIFKPTKLKEPEKEQIIHGSPVRKAPEESKKQM